MASRKIAAAAFVMALTLRLSNAAAVFAGGPPRIPLIDELYHWKRMTWSAAHFPAALEFDGDRGQRGLFCPWPPLYDVFCGGMARLLGARMPLDVLERVIWIPPVVAAMCVALATLMIGKHFGTLAALAAGAALSASPFLVTQSSIGDIDHHFLEWPLTFAVIGGIFIALRGRALLGGVVLAMAMIAAMFVQTALLIACGLAFAVLFAFTDGAAPAIAFSACALAVSLYRLTRLPGYPDNAWFLGWTHAALFSGAAVASAYLYFRKRRGFALFCGVAAACAFPSAPASILEGAHFFGGETWLQTIAEFQPIWKGDLNDWISHAAGLSIGVVLVWIVAWQAAKRRDPFISTIALYAIVYLALAISSRRFEAISIPLLATAAAVYASMISHRRLALLVAAAVALIPAVQLALWMVHPFVPIPRGQMPWLRTAGFLQQQRVQGRVLAPWTLGHVLDVVGQRPVIIDNFGTMPDAILFDRAHDALLARDEGTVARFCEESGARYVVLGNPLQGLTEMATSIGVDRQAFIVTDREGRPVRITRLAQATWWWRAYFAHGAAIPQQGMFGRPFRQFRLAWSDPQMSLAHTPYRGPTLMVWEYIGRVR